MVSQILDSKKINKKFVQYVIPSVIGMLVQALYVILDGVIVGQGIGEIALGAINIVFPFSMVVVALSMLIAVGGANVYSFYRGQGEEDKANNIFCQCLTLAVIIGILLALAGFFFRKDIAIFLGANDQLLHPSIAYLQWAAPFSLIQMVTFGLAVFVRNDDAPKIAMLGAVFGAVINAILDVIFILVLHYGIEVAAITNGIGVSIEFLFYSSHFIRKKGKLRIRKPVLHFEEIKKLLQNGIASSLMEFSVPALTFSYNLVIVKIAGTLGVSAFSIVSYVCSILGMVVMGVTQGVQPLMSFYHGTGEKKKFYHVYSLGIWTNLAASVLLIAVCVIFGGNIAPLFHAGNTQLTELTAHMLRQYPLAYMFIGVTLMNILFFQTMQSNGYATFISFLRCLGFVQVFLLISMFILNAAGIYLTFLAGELCHFIISYILVRKTLRENDTASPKAEISSSL